MNSTYYKKAAFGCLFFFISFLSWAQENVKTVKFLEEGSEVYVQDLQVEVVCGEKVTQYKTDLFGNVTLEYCEAPVLTKIRVVSLYYKLDAEYADIPEKIYVGKTQFAIHAAEVTSSGPVSIELPYFFPESSVQTIQASAFENGDMSSLRNVVNTIPGVKMDERGNGGSRRISIRGSFVRSPFAVRNVGLYYDGIPLTGADGSSPLEMIDNEDLSHSNILKGPNSIYGSGNGGVLYFNSYRPKMEKGLRYHQSITSGSYDYFRSRTGLDYVFAGGWLSASFVRQETSGYRDQESNEKSQFIFKGAYSPSPKLNYYGLYQHYDGSWDLPGSIDLETAQEDPQSANPYSEEINASVNRATDLIAIKQEWNIYERWNNETSIYFSNTDKTNPYGTSPFFNGYKEEGGSGYGGRTEFRNLHSSGSVNFQLRTGLEWQRENTGVDEFPLVPNEANDELKYSVDTDFERTMAFFRLDIFRKKFHLIPSLNYNSYSVRNEGTSFTLDTTLNNSFKPDDQLLKGLEFMYKTKFTQISLLYQEGLSNPGLFELVDVETGILNTELQPETGRNFEFTFRQAKPNNYFLELKAYSFILDESILPVVDQNDAISYTNGGKAFHDGLELSANKTIKFIEDSFIEYIILNSGFAYQQYKTDVDGKEYAVPGVPFSTWSNSLKILFAGTFTFEAQHYWSDQMPLDRTNEDYLNAYNVVNTRLSWEKRKKEKLELEIFAGLNNITNTLYTSFPQINAFGGRYYNPAPGTNFYGGLRVSLKLR